MQRGTQTLDNTLWLEYDGRRYASDTTRALDGALPGTAPHAMAMDVNGNLAVMAAGTPVAVMLLDKDNTVIRSEVRSAPAGASLRKIRDILDSFRGRRVQYRAT